MYMLLSTFYGHKYVVLKRFNFRIDLLIGSCFRPQYLYVKIYRKIINYCFGTIAALVGTPLPGKSPGIPPVQSDPIYNLTKQKEKVPHVGRTYNENDFDEEE